MDAKNDKGYELNDFGTCGVPVIEDSRKLNEDSSKRCAWPSKDISWSLENHPDYIDENDCIKELEQVFNLWAEAGEFVFRHLRARRGRIKICFGSPAEYPVLIKPDGREAPAFTYYPCSPEISERGRIIFNSEKNWSLQNRSRTGVRSRFFCFAGHEIGHALGIQTHGNPLPDAMAANPIGWEGPLSVDDKIALKSQYPETNNSKDEDNYV